MNHPDPGWDLYRTFLAVLHEGSLSGAARSLGLTQPTIGRHVDALEQAVGFQLFTRSQHGLAPTEAAAELRPYAEELSATAAALLRVASAQGGAVRGAVRITASEVIGAEVLPTILTGLHQQYPELVIELVLSNAVEDLLRRDADIAVRMVKPSQGALVADVSATSNSVSMPTAAISIVGACRRGWRSFGTTHSSGSIRRRRRSEAC